MLRRAPAVRCLSVEPLESRRLLSSDPVLDHAWIAHGFNPLQEWDEFRENYQPGPDGDYYNQLLTTLENRTETAAAQVTPVLWDSNLGWMQALSLNTVKGGMAADKWPAPAIEILNPALDTLIESGLIDARLQSSQTSAAIVQQILQFVQAKSPAEQQETNVYLVGHSLGGEVVARAMNNVRTELNALGVASQLVILDGYGQDWPGVAGQLGTESPFPVGAPHDVNMMVDLGLDELLTLAKNVTESIIDDTLRQIAGDVPLPENVVQDDIYSSAPWKAPIRSGMTNLILPGTNHLSISDNFFRDAVVVRQPDSASESSIDLGDLLTATVPTSGGGTAGVDIPLLTDIRGGSAQDLLMASQQVAQGAAGLPGVPESTRRLLDIFSSPNAWLRGQWQVAGNVQVDPISERIQLVGDASSMKQLVALPPGISKVVVEGSQINGASRPNDLLQLFLNGTLIGSLDGSELSQNSSFEFSIQHVGTRSLVGTLELRYRTDVAESGFALSSIGLLEQAPLVEVAVTDSYSEPRLEFSAVPGLDLTTVDFYMESNGASGLQVGQDGDVPLQLETQGATAVASVPDLARPPHQVLISFELSDGRLVYSELPIRTVYQTNIVEPLDVSEDGFATPLDALLVINYLNTFETDRALTLLDARVDVNLDGFATPLDALLIINYLNQQSPSGEGEDSESEDGLAVEGKLDTSLVEAVDWSWVGLKRRHRSR